MENLMTSGFRMDDPGFPAEGLKPLASRLNAGLTAALKSRYGMRLEGSRWAPLSPEELIRGFSEEGSA